MVTRSSTDQFQALFNICRELKNGQEEIKNNLINVQIKLQNLEEKFNSSGSQQELQESLETKLKSFEEKVELQNNSIERQIVSYADIVNTNYKKSFDTEKAITSISQGMENLQTKLSDEIEQKAIEQRSNNICIFNIPESTNNNQEEANKEDVLKIKQILDPQITIEKKNISSIFRPGFKSHDKVRPIIMKFNDATTRLKLLKLRNLKYQQGDIQTSIYITPDRTLKQQEFHKKLVMELKRRKENGEENIYIKNGKIQQLQPFRTNLQSQWPA